MRADGGACAWTVQAIAASIETATHFGTVTPIKTACDEENNFC
jgi:hypothetical protein